MLINSATLIVLASEREAFGLSALEAAFMARPVVATRRGGLPEVVEHGATGLLIDELNANHLAEAVSWLLEHPESAASMGRAARERAHALFDWENCVDAYETLYEKIVKAHAKRPREEGHV
jgi:glycosyltransferase involved in cell wall biosynthesis